MSRRSTPVQLLDDADARGFPRIQRMESLWQNASQLVTQYFQQDLPDAILQVRHQQLRHHLWTNLMQHGSAWKRLRSTEELDHHVPLPQTNSVHAKQMRIAVVLAHLARAVDKYLFDPTYILGAESGLREVFLDQAVRDYKRESFCRAILLSMPLDEQDIEDRIESVVEEVVPPVEDLLSDAAEQFGADVAEFAMKAYQVWRIMQRTTKRFEPKFNVALGNATSCDSIQFSETLIVEPPEAVQGGTDEALITILPRLYLIEEGKEPRALMNGTVLRRSQSMLAAQELEASSPLLPSRRSATTRHKAQRSWTMSSSVDRPFLGQGAASSAQ